MAAGTRVSIVGTGNVAWALAHALVSAGVDVAQVVSRSLERARQLAQPLGIGYASLEHIDPSVDVVILAVSDDAISQVAASLPETLRAVVAHTSGTKPSNLLDRFPHHGVFYPLQTFTKGVAVDFAEITIYTHASDRQSWRVLDSLASQLTTHVAHADDCQRARLHLAAVWACNFANFMWIEADEILTHAGMDFAALAPLLRATLDKALALGPAAGQTGPARRGDTHVLARHAQMLDADAAELYNSISNRILNKFNSPSSNPSHHE